MYTKITKLNPNVDTDENLEQEVAMVIKETPSSSQVGGQSISSPTTASVSYDQQETSQITKVVQGEKEKTVFDRFMEINLEN